MEDVIGDEAALCDMIPNDDLDEAIGDSWYFTSDRLTKGVMVDGLFDFEEQPFHYGKGKELKVLVDRLREQQSKYSNKAISLPSLKENETKTRLQITERKVEPYKQGKEAEKMSPPSFKGSKMKTRLELTKRKLEANYQHCKEGRKKTCLIHVRALPRQQPGCHAFARPKKGRHSSLTPPQRMIF